MLDDLRLILLADWSPDQLAAMAAAFILGILILLTAWRSRRNYLRLPELPAAPGNAQVDAAVIIPARNEAANIQRAAKSFPQNPVLVVDDRSTDDTASLARAAGATVITPPELQRGQLGKPNACQAGADNAPPSEWLLFIDADTWYEPGFLAALAAAAQRDSRPAVSAFPRQVRVTLAEKTILPYAFALYFAGVNARAIADPKHPATLANGQCMLFRRQAYQFLGGHRSVIQSVIEDVEMARVAKRHQMAFAVYRAEALASVRMYDSFGDIWRGFSKNSFRFLTANPATGIAVVLSSIIFTSWLPMLYVLVSLECWTAAALFALTPAVAFYAWYGSVAEAMLAPFAIYLFQAIALNALFRTTFGLPTLWKGRPV